MGIVIGGAATFRYVSRTNEAEYCQSFHQFPSGLDCPLSGTRQVARNDQGGAEPRDQRAGAACALDKAITLHSLHKVGRTLRSPAPRDSADYCTYSSHLELLFVIQPWLPRVSASPGNILGNRRPPAGNNTIIAARPGGRRYNAASVTIVGSTIRGNLCHTQAPL